MKYKFFKINLIPTNCVLEVIIQSELKIDNILLHECNVDIDLESSLKEDGSFVVYDVSNNDKWVGTRFLIILKNINPVVITHEAVHATYHLLEMINQKHDRDNHEIFAYYVSYILEEILIQESCQEWKEIKYD